jgi:LuxR family maltose regulon positive regulatory protein
MLPDGTSLRRDFDRDELCGRIATVRAILGMYSGDVDRTTQQGRKALELLPKEELIWRGVAAATLGMAQGWAGTGDLLKARHAFSEARDISEAAGNASFFLFASMGLAAIEVYRGRMKEALKTFRKLEGFIQEKGMADTGNASSIKSSIGAILFEMNETEEGRRLVEESIERADKAYDWIALEANRLNLVRILFSLGEYAEAQKVIASIGEGSPDLEIPPWMKHRLSSWKARTFLAVNNREAAYRWMQDSSPNLDEEITHRRESEFLVLVRILHDQNRLDEANILLGRLISSAEAGNRVLVVLESLLIRARVLYERGDVKEALGTLDQALVLAEAGGFVRIFIDEGPTLKDLLAKLNESLEKDRRSALPQYSRAYVKKLLIAFQAEHPPKRVNVHTASLSEREIEVLQLIAAGFSNQEIADRLFISLNTVRTHTKNINAKLDVHSRTRAIARAKKLGLL